jgi:hypothetical protein
MQLALTVNLDTLTKHHVVYSHEIVGSSAGILYVGCCPLKELMNFPDAKRNSEWRRLTKESREIAVKVISLAETAERGQTLQRAAAVALAAYCNAHGEQTDERSTSVVCINDGQIYHTIAAAARFYAIPATSISNHLAGRPGYGHVKGYQFRRV